MYSRQHPSPRYIDYISEYTKMHLSIGAPSLNLLPEKIYMGMSLAPYINVIHDLSLQFKAKKILDYGSGKGKQHQLKICDYCQLDIKKRTSDYWGVEEIRCYDPAFPPFSDLPKGSFDGVICTDVLEHIPEEDLSWVIEELFGFASKFLFCSIACYPGSKDLPKGDNAHCSVYSPDWWQEAFSKHEKKFSQVYWEIFCVQADSKTIRFKKDIGSQL